MVNSTYQPLPSAFQIAELPVRGGHDLSMAATDWLGGDWGLIPFAALGCTWPVALLLTPATMALDLALGLGEGALLLVKEGRDSQHAREVFHKKCVASMAQQGVVLLAGAIPYAVIALWAGIGTQSLEATLAIAGVFGTMINSFGGVGLYSMTQGFTGALPPSLNHTSFCIFRGEGASRRGFKHIRYPHLGSSGKSFPQWNRKRIDASTRLKHEMDSVKDLKASKPIVNKWIEQMSGGKNPLYGYLPSGQYEEDELQKLWDGIGSDTGLTPDEKSRLKELLERAALEYAGHATPPLPVSRD